MFVTLTNANPLHRGNPVAIRRDLIVTIHAATQIRDDGTAEQVTYIFLPPHGTWEVEEDYDTVLALLNDHHSS